MTLNKHYQIRIRIILLICFSLFVNQFSLAAINPTDAIMFKDFAGKKLSINNFTGKGKWLIVMIWASDCHICNREVANYIKFHQQHKANDATVLGISVDGWNNKSNAQEFIDKHKVTFNSIITSRDTIDVFYKQQTGKLLSGTPSFLIYSPSGELKAEQAGAVPTSIIEEFITEQSVQVEQQ